ncbi:GNAT family N-acetyltransferase [Streptomyces sp. NPDC048644]|uniref:GNAT family N-acetyltransferase n=1 Tax=Streptomyces sp. NPDC048644 TaxID=3365582 RepID=UPI003717EAA1
MTKDIAAERPLFVLPADPLGPRRTDPRFAGEAGAARAAGAAVALIGVEELLSGDAEGAVARVPRGTGPAWYRGRMLPAARYAELAAALEARGRTLVTSPAAYRTAHELPGGDGMFRGAVTPAGGAVLRACEPFGAGEARVWWVAGEPVLTCARPDTPEPLPVPVPDLTSVAPTVAALGLPFVTTDLARRSDGGWRVVEVGDGQVSGLPAEAVAGPLFEALVTVGAGFPLTLAAGRVALRALLPSAAARVADGEGAGFDWIDGAPSDDTSGGAGIVVAAAVAGRHRPGWGVFVLTDAADGRALGSIGFHGPPDADGRVEIGYDLSPSARGAGWATDAARLLAGWAAGRPEVRTVCATTEPDNVPSQRVLERAGFRPDGMREELRAFTYAGPGVVRSSPLPRCQVSG